MSLAEPRSTPAPVAVLGGTFDPPHHAHLELARIALEQLDASKVLWIPTGRPGYRDAPVASAPDRLAMLRALLAGEPRSEIDVRELDATATGYTVDTLAALRAGCGARVPLVLLLGTDQFAVLYTWSRWKTLFDLAHLAVYPRPGSAIESNPLTRAEFLSRRDEPAGRWREHAAGAIVPVAMEPLPHSATTIRARLSRGEDVSGMLPEVVLDVIRSRGLYR